MVSKLWDVTWKEKSSEKSLKIIRQEIDNYLRQEEKQLPWPTM
jgi:hypothetical protein